MDKITIRRLFAEDAFVLAPLAQRTFFDTFDGTCTPEDMQGFLKEFYSEEVLEAELSNPEDYYYLARVNDEPAGYLRFLERPVPSEIVLPKGLKALELNRLYVDKPFHKKGIAQRLMQVYYDHAARHDYRFLWLGVWEFNFRAQRFYEKEGFQYTGAGHPFPIGGTPQTDQWWVKTIVG